MMLTESKLFVGALKVAGPAFFLGMQASSVRTAISIAENRSTMALSPLPFISLLTNCIIWSCYGFLRQDNTVLIPNFAGVLSGGYCALTYHRFALRSPWQLYAGASAIALVAAFLSYLRNFQLLGSIGCVLAVILMASPLATIGTVLRDKSTAALPFATSFSGWCNALSWSAYGLLVANDAMIYGPNLVGLALASVQMLLFVLFGFPKATSPKPVF